MILPDGKNGTRDPRQRGKERWWITPTDDWVRSSG